MAAKAVGWGMIGTRGWSDMILGPAINAARGARFRAVLSSSAESAERYCARHGVARGYGDIDAFLADPAVDVVWVASPNHLHKAQTTAALRAGKHVLCEKPMAMSQAECRAMIRAASKAGRLLSIGYNSRHHPRLRTLCEQWRAGRFGAPVRMHASSTTATRRCRTTGGGSTTRPRAAGCWATSAPTSSTCCAGSTARRSRCTRTSPTRPIAAPPIPPSSPWASRTAPRHHLGLGRGHQRRRHRAPRQRRLLQGRGRLRRDPRQHHHRAQGGRAAHRPARGLRYLQGAGGERQPRHRPAARRSPSRPGTVSPTSA